MFDDADYRRAAARLDVPVAHVMAMAAVESSGETFWTVDGRQVVPVRFEAHLFGKFTSYRFNDSNPDLSSAVWRPSLAATTRAGAWDQVRRARALDLVAADEATSWGGFQVMGYHWRRLGYPGVQGFVDSMSSHGDDGQMDAFVAFVEADPALHASLAIGAWNDVERRYNGGGYGGAYADKLRAAVALYGGSVPVAVPRVLVEGMSGPDVAAVQVPLRVEADGVFGRLTAAAVRAFQSAHGLVADAMVGRMTRQALGV